MSNKIDFFKSSYSVSDTTPASLSLCHLAEGDIDTLDDTDALLSKAIPN